MKRARKLLFVLAPLSLLLGVLAVATPADAKRPGGPPCDSSVCDPACKHRCPDGKKIDHQTCIFAGCVPETGECTYSCPQ